MPLGFYMIWSVLLRRSGVMILLGLPFLFLAAFQIVLLYLFGNSIIATDMFTNILTTNPREAGELLANLYPAIIAVCLIYTPLLWFTASDIIKKRYIPRRTRVTIALVGGLFLAIGLLLLSRAYKVSEEKQVIQKEIFPINVLYNANLSLEEFKKMQNFEHSSAHFSHNATRTEITDQREIYVYVIGEASRAMNWQLYGYSRETNPQLSKIDGVNIFRNILTQSNTTHKSVPQLLSSIATDQHNELYQRSGLADLFNDVGFETWFISNQTPQSAMIDKLAAQANHLIYIDEPHLDMQLYIQMKQAIESSNAQKMLFILHTYGSHFSYNQRYSAPFSKFIPDAEIAIITENRDQILNAYDNSILYTDYYLSNSINYLKSLNVCSALLYCSDHGEDLMDDDRGRFLHSSPTTTAYQLHVASLVWFSNEYCALNPEVVENAKQNIDAPATSHSMFHTIADIASINSSYIKDDVSLVSNKFNFNAKRCYLNDHNKAIAFKHTGLNDDDINLLKESGIEL